MYIAAWSTRACGWQLPASPTAGRATAAGYNVIFARHAGDGHDVAASAQMLAFGDTWHWKQVTELTTSATIRRGTIRPGRGSPGSVPYPFTTIEGSPRKISATIPHLACRHASAAWPDEELTYARTSAVTVQAQMAKETTSSAASVSGAVR